MNVQRWTVVVRDVITMAVGAFGIIHSQISGQVSTELLMVYTALLGYPGIFQMMEHKRRRESDANDTPPS